MLFKRKKSDNWYFKFTLRGKTLYRSTGTCDKAQAQEIADKAKAEAYSHALASINILGLHVTKIDSPRG